MSGAEKIVNGIITEDNKEFYKEYGYLIAENLFDTEAIEKLKQEAFHIVQGKKGAIDGLLPEAEELSDEEVLQKYSAIHFPHKISSLIKDYAANKSVATILSNLVSPNMKCLQTMLFMKAPGKKGQSWHQDEDFIPTRDKSLVGAWIAMEDADEENGCLWVVPGSQKGGFIRRRIVNNNLEFADLEVADITPYTSNDFVKAEVKTGSVIFFNGYLLHMSLCNKTTNRFRRALVSHYSSAESMLPWNQDGRFNATHDFRDIFMVSGTDPYKHKGTQDLSIPFVRPDVLDFNTGAHIKRTEKK